MLHLMMSAGSNDAVVMLNYLFLVTKNFFSNLYGLEHHKYKNICCLVFRVFCWWWLAGFVFFFLVVCFGGLFALFFSVGCGVCLFVCFRMTVVVLKDYLSASQKSE